MEHSYKDQLERVDRLMTIVEADNQYELIGGLETIDIILFACQSMWHLKDWVRNDPLFGARNVGELQKDIHASSCLRVCADIANGSKHLSLDRPKVGAQLWEHTGVHVEPAKGIFRDMYYVVCRDLLGYYIALHNQESAHNGTHQDTLNRLQKMQRSVASIAKYYRGRNGILDELIDELGGLSYTVQEREAEAEEHDDRPF